MPRTRVDFRSLTLFEDEEAGDTHMAMYATVRDSGGTTIGQFKWNNGGNKVNETNTYPLNNDPGNISSIDFELDTFGTVTVEAYADDDQDWPTAGSNENALGSVSITFDPRVPATLGSVIIGPATTDNGNTGYLVNAGIAVVASQTAADVRIKFENLILYEDEESGDTHVAIYVRAKGPGIDQEIFRWNNGSSVLHLQWCPHDSGYPITFFVRYSHNGKDWLRPGVNLKGNYYYLDLREMPGGKRCVVQVLATNGYRTSYVQTRYFEVPIKPPDLLLGGTIGPVLFAQGFSREEGPITGDDVVWLIDDGSVTRRGGSLDLRTLEPGVELIEPGVHRVCVLISDRAGRQKTNEVGSYDSTTGLRVDPLPL
ncbi:MAG: hypothetical protein H0W86_14290 [Armatimonadetes bacterium]|nr:hypothetical protein [Armatimonadota bacterium]